MFQEITQLISILFLSPSVHPAGYCRGHVILVSNAFRASPSLPERSPRVVSAFYVPSKTLQYPDPVSALCFLFSYSMEHQSWGTGGNMWSLPLKAPGPHHLSCSPLHSIKYWDWGPWAEGHQGEDTLHLP